MIVVNRNSIRNQIHAFPKKKLNEKKLKKKKQTQGKDSDKHTFNFRSVYFALFWKMEERKTKGKHDDEQAI